MDGKERSHILCSHIIDVLPCSCVNAQGAAQGNVRMLVGIEWAVHVTGGLGRER